MTWRVEAVLALTRVLCARGDAGAAERVRSLLDDAAQIVSRTGARYWEAGVCELRGALARVVTSVDERILKSGAHHGSTYFQHQAFLRALREGTPPEVSARDGLLAVAMGLAAERSAAEGVPVELAV